MKAIILVGGFGTRLRPLTYNTPKAMIPVCGKPMIQMVFDRLKEAGITDIILAIGYLSNAIEDYFGNGEEQGLNITYVHEDPNSPLGTAGAIKNAAKNNVDGTFMVLNGDIITDISLNRMIICHNAYKAKVTIALHKVDDPSSYGLVVTDPFEKVLGFIEKPTGEVTTNTINAGIYIMEPEILDLIPDNVYCSVEKETFPLIIERGIPFYSYTDDSFWLDVGTPNRYFGLHTSMMMGRVKNKVFKQPTDEIMLSGLMIGSGNELRGPLYAGRRTRIGNNVRIIGPVVLGNDVSIDDGAVLENVIVWDNVHIGKNAHLSVVVCANNVTFGDNTDVSGTVIGDNVVINNDYPKITDTDIDPGTVLGNSKEDNKDTFQG